MNTFAKGLEEPSSRMRLGVESFTAHLHLAPVMGTAMPGRHLDAPARLREHPRQGYPADAVSPVSLLHDGSAPVAGASGKRSTRPDANSDVPMPIANVLAVAIEKAE